MTTIKSSHSLAKYYQPLMVLRRNWKESFGNALVIISALWYLVSTFSTAICLFRMYCRKWCNWTAKCLLIGCLFCYTTNSVFANILRGKLPQMHAACSRTYNVKYGLLGRLSKFMDFPLLLYCSPSFWNGHYSPKSFWGVLGVLPLACTSYRKICHQQPQRRRLEKGDGSIVHRATEKSTTFRKNEYLGIP